MNIITLKDKSIYHKDNLDSNSSFIEDFLESKLYGSPLYNTDNRVEPSYWLYKDYFKRNFSQELYIRAWRTRKLSFVIDNTNIFHFIEKLSTLIDRSKLKRNHLNNNME